MKYTEARCIKKKKKTETDNILGERGMNRQRAEVFFVLFCFVLKRRGFLGNTLYDTIMVDTFVHIHRVCTTKVKPNVGYGFWVIMMCQCIFISCSKYTTLVGILIVGKTVHTGGQCWASWWLRQ